MITVALLSNPIATGNKAMLSRVRSYCDLHADILHLEVDRPEEIGAALDRIAAAKPRLLVINGGDGTVQATLTEFFQGERFGPSPPPVTVLPNGKTNLIAKDLGATGDPVRALERALTRARGDMTPYVVLRDLIALSDGSPARPVLGMFLGAGALADTILFCRHRIYPMGLPNGVSHLLTVLSGFLSVLTDKSARFMPPKPTKVSVTTGDNRPLLGRFQVLMVTTLHELVLTGKAPTETDGMLHLLAIERRPVSVFRAILTTLMGKLGRTSIPGVHLQKGTEIRIEADHANVILDGELFEATRNRPIILKPTAPVRFMKLSA